MNKPKCKAATLGPEYSYSDILTRKEFPDCEIILCNSIPEIFEKVAGKEVSKGIAPIENMMHGTVRESLISLWKYKIKINKELDIPIRLCLASKKANFKKIISKMEALSQCSQAISSYKGKVTIEETSSTSKAMEIASKDEEYAAIGSKEAAASQGLNIINENVADNLGNVTRFVEISLNDGIAIGKNVRTSMMIVPKGDRAGLLHEILSIFKEKNINLTKIESIPSGKKLGEYEFFIEIEGNQSDDEIKDVLTKLGKIHEVYCFGSYEIKRVG